MRKYLMPVLAATAILGTTGAFAAEVTGTIESKDAAKQTVTLDNGQVYHLPRNENLSELQVGDAVIVTFETTNGQHMATIIDPMPADTTGGK